MIEDYQSPFLPHRAPFLLETLRSALTLLCRTAFLFALFCSTLSAEELPFREFKGKKVRTIRIELKEIFEDSDDNLIFRQANSLKFKTREEVIRRELLIREGDTFDPFLLRESERDLRSLRYLRNVSIHPVVDGDYVDLIVQVQDTWTLIPQFAYSSGTGRTRYAGGLADSNFLGYGKRAEVLYEKDEDLDSIEAVYDDSRFLGTQNRLLLGLFDRSDGERSVISFGRPFHSLVQDTAWSVNSDVADLIGRLYQNGEERYIFRKKVNDVGVHYTISRGNPEHLRHRFAFGYGYEEADFSPADAQDYKDVDVDPASVSQDPEMLASNRRFSGPTLNYHRIEPDYISRDYIDRFDRVEDYNLGQEFSVNSQIAPQVLGSLDDTYLLSSSISDGIPFGADAFLRGESGFSTRADSEGLANSTLRAELKYYNVMGMWEPFGLYLGRHTFASSLSADYGEDLDKDREFLLGSDNGLRGYDARTFTGDKRLILNLEDRVHLYDDVFQLLSVGSAVFLDVGGSTYDSLGDLAGHDMYSAAGVGLRFGFPRSSGGRVFRVDIAVPLRDGPDGSKAGEPRIILSGGQVFGARLRTETLGPENANVEVGANSY